MRIRSDLNYKAPGRTAFSLLEVVVSLAMLAMIAVPAMGLAVLTIKRNAADIDSEAAYSIKRKIDVALRSGSNVFAMSFTDSNENLSPVEFVASENLRYIENKSSAISKENDRYFLIEIVEPIANTGNVFDPAQDASRMLLYKITWPNNAVGSATRYQRIFTSVFRK